MALVLMILTDVLLQGLDRFHSIEAQYGELQMWLQEKVLYPSPNLNRI